MRSETSPTARALLTLEILQNSPGITAERLGERLGVSDRAVRRYVEILREADIPVVSVRGPAGGYRLGRGARLPPLIFNAPEVLGVVMAVLDGHHEAGDPHGPVGSALGQSLGALPESVAAQARTVRDAAAAAPDRAAARPDPATTVALVEASAGRRRVRLGYRSEAGNELTVEVEPWAVVVRHSRWYLLCRSLSAEAVRAYRVDRVTCVDVLPGTFDPPADLDPVGALEEHLASGWAHPVVVVIDAPIDRARRWVPRHLGRLEPVGTDTARLVGSTSNPAAYAADLTVIPGSFRVVEGTEVREAVGALGRRLVAASGAGPPDLP